MRTDEHVSLIDRYVERAADRKRARPDRLVQRTEPAPLQQARGVARDSRGPAFVARSLVVVRKGRPVVAQRTLARRAHGRRRYRGLSRRRGRCIGAGRPRGETVDGEAAAAAVGDDEGTRDESSTTYDGASERKYCALADSSPYGNGDQTAPA